MISCCFDTFKSICESTDWSVWIPIFSTIVLTILTFIYVRLTKGLLESQSNPCVVVSVIHDDERPSILQLAIKNVGPGLAQDITFELSQPIPTHAWGISKENAKSAEKMTHGPLIDGIPALGPGERRLIDWGQYGGLLKNLGSDTVTVICKFKKNGKNMPPIECKLDIKSFEGTIASEHPIPKIAKYIEKISQDLHQLASGHSKLHIEIAKDDSEVGIE